MRSAHLAFCPFCDVANEAASGIKISGVRQIPQLQEHEYREEHSQFVLVEMRHAFVVVEQLHPEAGKEGKERDAIAEDVYCRRSGDDVSSP